MKRKEMLQRLSEFDETLYYLSNGDLKLDLIVVGGAALVLNFSSLRSTPDIDIPYLKKEIAEIAGKYDINSKVNAYCDCFPYNYQERLIKIKGYFKCVTFYTPSLEDVVVTKLIAFRPKDREDLYSKNILSKLDWEKLIKIIEIDHEVEMNCLSPTTISFFKMNYETFKRDNYKK